MSVDKILNLVAIIVLPTVLFVVSPYWNSAFKDKKEIQYEIVSRDGVSSFGFSGDGWPSLKVLYGDEKIDRGGFILIWIENTGSVPIRTEDFEDGVTVEFDSESTVVAFRKISSSPKELSVSEVLVGNKIKIKPLLLNPGDGFYAEALIKGNVEFTSVGARIVGVKELKKKEREVVNGLYVEKITGRDGASSSTHQSIFYLNCYILFFAAYVFLSASFTSSLLRMRYHRRNDVLDVILSVCAFMSGFYCLAMAVIAVSIARYQALSLMFGTTILALVSAYFIGRIIFNLNKHGEANAGDNA